MSLRLAAAFSSLFLGVIACTTVNGASDGSSGGNSPGSGGATVEQTEGCKSACNKMKFFGCNSADEQAACYSDCGSATPSQIELFTACAGTSICDPACRTNIVPKSPEGTPAKGGGGSESSCTTACEKAISCSFLKVGDKDKCLSSCQSDAYQYQIDCINNNACDKIINACGGGTGNAQPSGGSSVTVRETPPCATGPDGVRWADGKA